MHGMAFDEFLLLFCKVHQTGPTQYIAQCPAHDDDKASLSIGQADSGLTLLYCQAQCSTAAILRAVNLEQSDLYPPTEIAPGTGGRRVVAAYDYTDADGTLLYQSVRLDPKDFRQRHPDGNGAGGWIWNTKGIERVLYRLPQLVAAPPDQPVFVVEGEKDADRLAMLGLVATTNVGGAGKWLKKYGDDLRGRLVAILPDNDQPGREHAADVAEKLTGVATSVVVIHLPGLAKKEDVSDWLDHGGTVEQLLAFVAAPPPPWPPLPVDEVGAAVAAVAEDDERIPVTNAAVEWVDDVAKIYPLSMEEIVARIFEQTGGWPRRVDSALFVHEPGREIHWLENAPSLFGWLANQTGPVEWRRAVGCATKDELFQQIRRSSESYAAIERLPHFPPLAGHYYACDVPEPGNGDTIAKLVDQFQPASDQDQMLILALFATLFWGGEAGRRPAFLITSDDGRGVGKSILTDMVSRLVGGHIELSPMEDASRLRSRLLSPKGLEKRVARLDNVKTLRFSWADLESVITSSTISGHRLHVGEASRPNNLTWLITLNGPSLGTDIAQRVVTIKIRRPHRVEAWEADTLHMIDDHRQEIIGDIRKFFALDADPIPVHGRWATWEGQVLARLTDPLAIQKTLFDRSIEADVELEEIETLEEYFVARLRELNYSSTAAVHVPSAIACAWFNLAMNERKNVIQVSKTMTQFCKEQRSRHLTINPSRKYGRGFVFRADPVTSFTTAEDGSIENPDTISYDLEDRIERRGPRNDRF